MTDTQTAPNIFDRALALLREKGWIQGRNQDEQGHICLVNALRTVADFSRSTGLNEYNDAFARLGSQVGRNPVIWNDTEGRTFAEVEALLETASRNYEQEKAASKWNGFYSASEIDAEIAKYTYKPGWEISRSQGGALLLQARVENSRQHGSMITVLHMQPFDMERQTPEVVRHAVKRLLKTYEDHEFDEWFSYNGKLIDDPHSRIIIQQKASST